MATCFPISNFTGKKHLYPGDVCIARKEEDSHFCRIFDAAYIPMPFQCHLEMHGSLSFDADPKMHDQNAVHALFAEMVKVIEKIKPDNLVVSHPNGKREHPDHRVVFRVARMLCKNRDLNLFLVDDVPYSTIAQSLGLEDQSIAVSKGEALEKHGILENCYYSQSSDSFHKAIDRALESTGGMERLFRVKRYDLSSVLFLSDGSALDGAVAHHYFNALSLESESGDRACARGIQAASQALPTGEARRVSRDVGLHFENHRPLQVSPSDLKNASHIFALDSRSYAVLRASHPGYLDKTSMLADFSSKRSHGHPDIPRPYAEKAEDIFESIDALLKYQAFWP